jgi:putative addiction module component (TIGR02574 family)
MKADVDRILDAALALATGESSALVVALLESLDSGAGAGITDAWREELNRRCAALRCGATHPVTWSDARARLLSL